MTPTALLLWALGIYYAIGLVVGLRFILATAPRLDPVARKAPLRVRMLFLPGAIAVWPLTIARAAALDKSNVGGDA